jgi:signal transduction histidine kinase
MTALGEDEIRRLRHDLRSPLVVIAGFAQLLTTDEPVPDDTRRDYAERIRQAADEMSAIVDGALGR